MVRTLPSNVESEGLIPGWGAKIQKKKKKQTQNINNRSNIVTNSIKALQMVHIKKKIKKRKRKPGQGNSPVVQCLGLHASTAWVQV